MENKSLSLINKIIVGVIAIIGVILYFMIMKDPDNADGVIDAMLNFTYLVLAIAAIVSFWVWLKELISHPGKLKQTVITAVIFLAIVLFAKYVLASNQAEHYYPNIDVDANTSNLVDTGLYTFYILGTIAILLMFLSPILSVVGGGSGKNSVEEETEEIEA